MQNPNLVSRLSLFTLFGAFLALFLLIASTQYSYTIVGVPIAISIISFWIRDARVWLYTVACSFVLYFMDSGEGVTGGDAALGAFIQGSLFLWLTHRLFVSSKPFVRGMFDYLIVAYFLYSLLNVGVAMAEDTQVLDWTREWTLGSAVLYYFPIREHFQEKNSFYTLLIVASLAGLFQIITNIKWFLFVAHNAEYAWQIAGRRSTPFLFLVMSIYFLLFTAHSKKLKYLIPLSLGTLLSVIGVFLTFSRTSMILLVIACSVMLVFVTKNEIKRIALIAFTAVALPILVMPFALGNLATIARSVIINRFLSSGKGVKDAAVQARLYEYKAVLRLVEKDPYSGYGLATPYVAYIPITKFSTQRSYIHNGYLSVLYRFGFLYTLLFYTTILYATGDSFAVMRQSKSQYTKLISLASFLSMICVLIMSTTDTLFFVRSSTFVIAFAYAGTGIARILNGKNQEEGESELVHV